MNQKQAKPKPKPKPNAKPKAKAKPKTYIEDNIENAIIGTCTTFSWFYKTRQTKITNLSS